ncbi:glycoside hydrolase family 3 protein [Deinococcus sp.]|uniref:glycoside hydrolase family 3 protein n=1 Tax=Deinococcus sp. TaxID=47478 RepID=UPI003C7D1152
MPPHPLTPEEQQFVEHLLSQMTLAEKIGQMTQPEKNSVRPGDVARLGLGSVLSGGGGNPDPNTPASWRAMVSGLIEESLSSRLKIPLIYGVDAVHGHNNVVGATIFPHNIGLGATRDPGLLRRIGRATALEVAATDVRWDFAPAVSVPQDFRWGRSYEGYSQDTELVSELAAAFILGLRGETWNTPSAVLPSVKHFVADAATTWGSSRRIDRAALSTDRTLAIARMGQSLVELLDLGAWQIDQGDAEIDEQTLRAVHLAPYRAALAAGALNVMASYSSWRGLKLHGHHYLLTEVLKGELGFQGFVVSDWEGIDQLGSDYDACVALSVNAGIDMVMVPFDYERFIGSLTRAALSGQVSPDRIDDAARRILTAKVALGLFWQPHTDPALLSLVGCPEHRLLAREAVSRSAVLLNNAGGVLPLDPAGPELLVTGQGADDLGAQCGGWTVSWMGGHGTTTVGTTLLAGLKAIAGPERVHFSADGQAERRYPVGVVVLAEEPYAEGMGDRADLHLNPDHLALIGRTRVHCERLVVVLLSGRPLIVTEHLPGWDAFVAAWLPGTEGQGLADVLYGLQPFTGRLPCDWPATQADLPRRPEAAPLFEMGTGLTTPPPARP